VPAPTEARSLPAGATVTATRSTGLPVSEVRDPVLLRLLRGAKQKARTAAMAETTGR
jgi:hypothetical protein